MAGFRSAPEAIEELEALTPLNIILTETVLGKLPVHNLAKKGRLAVTVAGLQARHTGGETQPVASLCVILI